MNKSISDELFFSPIDRIKCSVIPQSSTMPNIGHCRNNASHTHKGHYVCWQHKKVIESKKIEVKHND